MTTRPHLTIISALMLAAVLTACAGEPGDQQAGPEAVEAGSPVEIEMHDIGFDKTTLTVAATTEVEFEFTNTGKIPHDAFIGDHAAQLEHDAEMAEMATMTSMDMGHGDGTDEQAITVEPGASGSLTYTFDTPGTYEIGCHQPGHYAAGMTITVIVT